MAQFYGRLISARGSSTRTGTKSGGMETRAETWSYVVVSDLSDREGIEWARVTIETKNGTQVAVLFDGPLTAEHIEWYRASLVGVTEQPQTGGVRS